MMQVGDQMTARNLPQGDSVRARVRSVEGRIAMVEVDAGAFPLDQPVELSDKSALYLGIVRQSEELPDGARLIYLELEHRLERSRLAEAQSAWEGERAFKTGTEPS